MVDLLPQGSRARSALFLGMNPGRPRILGKQSAINRLYRWADHLGLVFWFLENLYDEPGEFQAKKVDLDRLKIRMGRYDGIPIISLGNEPAKALKKIGRGHFLLPHPSYRNRKLNSAEYEEAVLRECDAWLRKF